MRRSESTTFWIEELSLLKEFVRVSSKTEESLSGDRCLFVLMVWIVRSSISERTLEELDENGWRRSKSPGAHESVVEKKGIFGSTPSILD